jgi:hypothetical protein
MLSIIILNVVMLSVFMLSVGRPFTPSKVATFVLIEWRHDIEHNGTQHNDIQHNDTQHNDTQHNDTQHIELTCNPQRAIQHK